MTKRPKRDRAKQWSRAQGAVGKGVSDSAPNLYVLDSSALWDALERSGASRALALEAVGVDRKQRQRLKSWKQKTVSHDLRDKFLAAARPANRTRLDDDLRQCLVTRAERALLLIAQDRRRRTVGVDTLATPKLPAFAPDTGSLRFIEASDHDRFEARLAEFDAAWERVKRLLPDRSLTSVNGQSFFARWRILEPLVHWQESGFTERRWTELSDDEFKRFVTAGLERESIIASRESDLTRIRSALQPHGGSPAIAAPDSAAQAEDEILDDPDVSAAFDEIEQIFRENGIDAAIRDLPDEDRACPSVGSRRGDKNGSGKRSRKKSATTSRAKPSRIGKRSSTRGRPR